MIKRYNYLLETILFSVLVLLVGYLRGNPAFVGENLHPFYVVILLIVLRYGYLKGLLAVFIPAGLYVGFYIQRTGSISIHDFWGDCYQPITFLAFGMFVGLLTEVDKKKIERLNQTISELNEAISRKNTEIEKISVINTHISDQLSISDQTFNILFNRTKNLFNEDINILYQTTYEILMKTVKATKGYLFYLDGSHFKLACPKEAHKEGMEFLSKNEDHVEDVWKSHDFIRLDTMDENVISGYTPVFLGPIIHKATNTIYGMLAVEELDFTRYNESTFLTFTNLCKWIGEVLYFRSSQYAAITPVEKGIVEFKYLVKFGASRSEVSQFVKEYFYE